VNDQGESADYLYVWNTFYLPSKFTWQLLYRPYEQQNNQSLSRTHTTENTDEGASCWTGACDRERNNVRTLSSFPW
jgi:hypothetical protein